MKVDIGFKPGDVCFFIHNNVVCQSHVTEVYLDSCLTNFVDVFTTVKYKTFCELDREVWLNPGDIFHDVEGVLEKLRIEMQCNSLR